MTRPHPRSAEIQSRRISRIPAFAPVPPAGRASRYRADGWTPARQGAFIGYLAEMRSVSAAAARVGLSRESAYRLRRRAGAAGFCAAWDAVMGGAIGSPHGDNSAREKVTVNRADRLAQWGPLRPVMRRGRYVGTVRKAGNTGLVVLLKRVDRLIGAGD